MSIPEQGSILAQFEASRTEGNLFQTQRDYDAQYLWTKEQVEKLGASVHLFVTSNQRDPQGPDENDSIDPLYGDILDPEFFSEPPERDKRKLNIRCLIEHHPSKQSLKRYGIDEVREVIFFFPFKTLKDLGLVTEHRFRGVDIGDLILWDGAWYIALNVHREAYFGQTISPYFTSVACIRYRHNAVPTEHRSTHNC